MIEQAENINIFNIRLENFNGPLDLLLKLIKDKKMDLLNINLLEVTNQYLEIIDTLKKYNFDIAAEYLSMASYLLKIKSNLLLPKPVEYFDVETYEKEERSKLIKRLIEYKKYKDVINKLKEYYENHDVNKINKEPSDISFLQNYFDKNIYNEKNYNSSKNMNLEILMNSMVKILKINKINSVVEKNIYLDTVSTQEREEAIEKMVENNKNKEFSLIQICKKADLKFILITIVAILDLCMKQKLFFYKSKNKEDIIFKYKS